MFPSWVPGLALRALQHDLMLLHSAHCPTRSNPRIVESLTAQYFDYVNVVMFLLLLQSPPPDYFVECVEFILEQDRFGPRRSHRLSDMFVLND